MKRLALLFASAALLLAQSTETAVFIAPLSSQNEVPPISGYDATGTAVLYAHVIRDAAGEITSGSVDFVIHHNFPDTPTVSGLHIHTGVAGVNGGVVINTGIAGGDNAVVLTAGRGILERQAQVPASNAAALSALRGLFTSPANYYVNLHTTAYAGGVIRGQVFRAERAVRSGRMTPAKENPAVTGFNGSATGTVDMVRAYDSNLRFVGGSVVFRVDYSVPEATTFTGLHIHSGNATSNGPVVINTGIAGGANSVESAASGNGTIVRRVEIVPGTAAVAALEGAYDVPSQFYLNIHSSRFPGGVMRSQLYQTESVRMTAPMLPSNEVPPVTGLDASAPSAVEIEALRDETGAVVAAYFTFDVNYRFPGEIRFTGLHIHDGKAGANGPVTINSALAAFTSATGSGNIWLNVHVAGGNALAAVNSLLATPENQYLNLHTSVNAGGAVRAQMGVENTRTPSVNAVFSAISDNRVRTVAPGGLFTVFGNDLVRMPADLSGLESRTAPSALNGTRVTIGGVAAPLVLTGIEPRNNPPHFIVAQVPVEVPAGDRAVVVTTPAGSSAARNVAVAAQAPALYFDSVSGIFFRPSTLAVVRPGDAAQGGESLAVLSTGLGQTTPPLATGEVPSMPNPAALGATMTVGGRAAVIAGSAAVPEFPGFYLTLFQVPAGLSAGNQPVVLRVNGVDSNTVMLPVR